MKNSFLRFLNKHQNHMTFLALPLAVAGFLLHHTPLGNEIPHAVVIALFLIVTFLCGLPIIIRGLSALRWKTVSIELLVTIAVAGALLIGEYAECGIVTFLFQFGNYLEGKTLGKTRSAIRALVDSAPRTALRIEACAKQDDPGSIHEDTEYETDMHEPTDNPDNISEIDVDEIEPGDRLLIREGDLVAADGQILQGQGFFNEASITGESGLVAKKSGDFVYAGSVLESGLVELCAKRVGEDTTYARIIELVEEAEDAKSPVERFIDRFAHYYTPFVILAAGLTLLFTRNIDSSVTILVLACPGALVIGAPIANVSGIGNGAKNGILFKGADVVHSFARCRCFLFDKTGTLTYGDTRVATCKSYLSPQNPGIKAYARRHPEFQGDQLEKELLSRIFPLVAAVEARSGHPLGKAIQDYVKSLAYPPCAQIPQPMTIRGQGLLAPVHSREENASYTLFIGNESLFKEHGFEITPEISQDIADYTSRGQSIVLVGFALEAEEATHVDLAPASDERQIVLSFGISDLVRDGAKDVIHSLKKSGRNRVCMLTGDHKKTASDIAASLGIDEVYAELLPEEKYKILEDMQRAGQKVCFVGDGINDSPALTLADTGIAMGQGTDVAIECSDIVILNSDITKLPLAHKLARKTVLITIENIVIAVATVSLLLLGLLNGFIHMSNGMLIHELSIFVVILNGMRLLSGRDIGKN